MENLIKNLDLLVEFSQKIIFGHPSLSILFGLISGSMAMLLAIWLKNKKFHKFFIIFVSFLILILVFSILICSSKLENNNKEKISTIIQELKNDYFIKQGVDLAKDGNFREAITKYNKAIELNSKNFIAYEYKGYAYFKLNELSEAENSLRKSISIEPSYVFSHYNLALVLWQKDKKNESLDELEKSVKIDQSFIEKIKKDPQSNVFKESDRFNKIIN